MYVYKIIHILQEYTHTKTYTSPNLKGCFQEVEEMEQQMTSSKQSEGGKRKKKDKTGWQKKKKEGNQQWKEYCREVQRALSSNANSPILSDCKQGLSYKILSSGKIGITVVISWYNN